MSDDITRDAAAELGRVLPEFVDPPRPDVGEGFFDVVGVLGTMRRNAWLLVLLTILGVAGAFWMVSRELQMYQGVALIRLMDARSALTSGIGDEQQASTVGPGVDAVLSEIMVLRGRGVLRTVVDELGLRLLDASSLMPPSWASNIHVALPPEKGLGLDVYFGSDSVTAVAVEGPDATLLGPRVSAPYGSPVAVGAVRFTVAQRPAIASVGLAALPRYTASV